MHINIINDKKKIFLFLFFIIKIIVNALEICLDLVV